MARAPDATPASITIPASDPEAARALRQKPAVYLDFLRDTFTRAERAHFCRILATACVFLLWLVLFYLAYILLDQLIFSLLAWFFVLMPVSLRVLVRRRSRADFCVDGGPRNYRDMESRDLLVVRLPWPLRFAVV
jgi:small-conductance mechanosensitive channel